MGAKPPKHNTHQSTSLITSKDDPDPYRSNVDALNTSAKSILANAQHARQTPNTAVLSRQKVVTYELCQTCGGQRPLNLPVSSSLTHVKFKLTKRQPGSMEEEGVL